MSNITTRKSNSLKTKTKVGIGGFIAADILLWALTGSFILAPILILIALVGYFIWQIV